MTTSCRVLQANLRLYSLSKTDGHPWDAAAGPKPAGLPYRRDAVRGILADWQPSIIGFQETDQRHVLPGVVDDLMAIDNQPWDTSFRGKVGVGWNAAKWKSLQRHAIDMDNRDEADRRAVFVQLESLRTGGRVWAGSTHLGVHFDGSDEERKQQMATIVGALKVLGATADVPVIIFGDYNDNLPELALGVRQVAAQEGYRGLRDRLDDAALVGNSRNTHHGWKTTKRDGEWIDDILVSEAVKPINAEVVLTDPTAKHPCASDHNFLFARARF